MRARTFMLMAGEPSGDLLGAELVLRLREECARRTQLARGRPQAETYAFPPTFFGAGGPRMAEAGMELVVDLTVHAVVGLVEVLRHYRKFKHLFRQLTDLAFARQPDAIICIDFSGFNRRFAHAIRERLRRRSGPFQNWRPRIIQYVSPQVWASRPGRARTMARDLDLLLSIFPFEKDWFARQTPGLRVEFVGHPIMERHAGIGPRLPGDEARPIVAEVGTSTANAVASEPTAVSPHSFPLVLLLPGSRLGELKLHLPVMLKTAGFIGADWPSVRFRLVLPSAFLVRKTLEIASNYSLKPLRSEGDQTRGRITVTLGRLGVRHIEISHGGLVESLQEATVAIASTGTVTLECAYFGMPTVAIYKTSWLTYQVARHIIRVQHLAMPNLLAGETVYPEFIQHQARPQLIAREALELMEDPARRRQVQAKLVEVIASLGGPGAGRRSARAIWNLLCPERLAAPTSAGALARHAPV